MFGPAYQHRWFHARFLENVTWVTWEKIEFDVSMAIVFSFGVPSDVYWTTWLNWSD